MFKALFTDAAPRQGLVEKRHDAHQYSEVLYIDDNEMKIAAMRLDIAVCWPRRECWIVYDFAVSPGSQRVWLRRECWVYMISQ